MTTMEKRVKILTAAGKGRRAVMIWTPDGVWRQTYGADGAVKLQGCGKMPLCTLERWCMANDMILTVRVGSMRASMKPPTIAPPPPS